MCWSHGANWRQKSLPARGVGKTSQGGPMSLNTLYVGTMTLCPPSRLPISVPIAIQPSVQWCQYQSTVVMSV